MNGLPHELVGEFIDAVVRDPARAEAMLNERPELLNARWIHDETVLHFLAIEGFTEGVRFLAVRGADVNAVNEFGDTALVDIAGLGLTEIADVLLTHGANPDARSESRDNPLHAAARAGHAELVRRLLKAGANARYCTDLGESVFDAVNENPSAERQETLAALREYDVRDPETE
jgi:ankyrin repeat protein